MFGIGFSELAIIALVLIVMIRPKDMPAFFRKMGRLYGQIKSAYKEVAAVKDEFLKEMDVAATVEADSASAENDSKVSDAAADLADPPPSDPID